MTAAMLRSVLRRSTMSATASYRLCGRRFASAERKVAILGAAGGIGQPLSVLMKLNPLVSRLALYDIAGTPGIAANVSHVNTRSEGEKNEQMREALEGSAAVPKPMSTDTPTANISDEEIIPLLLRPTQDGGTQIIEAKARKGLSTL